MARMNGCNHQFEQVQQKQGRSTITPGKFARNNLSKGGVNDHMGGTDVKIRPPLTPGAASQGKHKNMPKGY